MHISKVSMKKQSTVLILYINSPRLESGKKLDFIRTLSMFDANIAKLQSKIEASKNP